MASKVSMKIAFFGIYGSFDYVKIGGVESFSRRLATGLIQAGHEADFVIYGAPAPEHRVVDPGIGLHYFCEIKAALQFLTRHYGQIITLHLPLRDRWTYLSFRRLHQSRLKFHQVYFNWPDSLVKRKAAFLEARLYPFNGRLFCVSPRQYHYVRRWSPKAVLLLPPVWESYFLEPEAKPKHDKLRVTYIGRTEPGKGIEDVIYLYKELKDQPQIEIEIHGFYHQHTQIGVKFHEWLNREAGLRYFHTPFEGYSPEVDLNLARILHNTDILVLPYQKLSSTIDTPVLLLEGMAALCAVATKPLGDIPTLYGPSPFILKGPDEMASMIKRLQSSPELLTKERQRIFHRNAELGFSAAQVAARLIGAIA
jgi:glycosyltransferase involved in cell wall biosynthesis